MTYYTNGGGGGGGGWLGCIHLGVIEDVIITSNENPTLPWYFLSCP